ncbi:hypothetical protein ACVWW9_000675 [Agrococcus sp. UYP33]
MTIATAAITQSVPVPDEPLEPECRYEFDPELEPHPHELPEPDDDRDPPPKEPPPLDRDPPPKKLREPPPKPPPPPLLPLLLKPPPDRPAFAMRAGYDPFLRARLASARASAQP